jgi:hypothetical protein
MVIKIKSTTVDVVVLVIKGYKNSKSVSKSINSRQIKKNCIDSVIGFWVFGLKPHS